MVSNNIVKPKDRKRRDYYYIKIRTDEGINTFCTVQT